MPNVPNTTANGLILTSVGDGTNASRWNKVLTTLTNNAWTFYSNNSYSIYTTYLDTFATETISGFTKYAITVVIDTPSNSGTATNTPNIMYLRIHDSVTGTNVINDAKIGTLYFSGTTAYSPGTYVWSSIYTASSEASRTLTTYVRVSNGGASSQQINGSIIGIS